MGPLRVIGATAILAAALGGCGGGAPGPSRTASTSSGALPGATRSSTGTRTPTPTATTTTPSASIAPPSREVSPGVVRASARDIIATMHASTHRPRVSRAWPVSFIVTRAGRPVKAEVRYQYLFAGQVVARRSHYRFDGSFHDVFIWPASAVGYPLTFRAVISAAGATLNLDYAVQVAR